MPKQGNGEPKRTCTFQAVEPAPESPYAVDVYSPDCMFAGTTLFGDVSPSLHSSVVEVDFAGRVIWAAIPSRIVSMPKGSRVMDVERLPSGNTLFNVKNYGAVEVTREGKEVWRHRDNGMPHDVDRLPNGNTIYVRGWASKGQDHVREVDPSGKLVWSWNGLAQYDKPPFADQDDEGWIHVNAVTRLADGNTMIGLRNFDRTAIVDPSGNVVHEAVYGTAIPPNVRAKFKSERGSDAVARPHDPEALPDGNILVAFTGLDRLVEVTRDGHVARQVARWPVQEDHQGIRDVNRLPNGNTLVAGYWRIFELTPDGQVVWSLHRKGVQFAGRRGLRHDIGSSFFKAQRIAPDGTAYGG